MLNRMFFAQNVSTIIAIIKHYGRLYNGYTILSGNLAPYGWKIPSYEDWVDLYTTVGYGAYITGDGTFTLAGGHLKEVGTENWNAPNTGADNSHGFTALGAGVRRTDGIFENIKVFTDFWSSTPISASYLKDSALYYNTSTVYTRSLNAHKFGMSVRCCRSRSRYGALYNWHAVNKSNILAPANCHIPTKAELETLISYVGGTSVAGGAMKENNLSNWIESISGTTNSSNFLGLPGGERGYNGGFYSLGTMGKWWTSTQGTIEPQYAFTYLIYGSANSIDFYEDAKGSGMSVRCLCDIDARTITDIDGNVYDTVIIGTQRWLVQDLMVTRYRDGSSIGFITDDDAWRTAGYAQVSAMCYYNNSLPVANQPTTMLDHDNNIYDVVKIGNQLWMKQNLKSTTYNDGTIIPNITSNTEWAALTTGAMCAYDNDENNV